MSESRTVVDLSYFVSAGGWENGLSSSVVGEQAIWLAEVVGMRSEAVVDDVGN